MHFTLVQDLFWELEGGLAISAIFPHMVFVLVGDFVFSVDIFLNNGMPSVMLL